MPDKTSRADPVSPFFWRALSVRLFYKIMGIGLLVAIIFGGVTLLFVRHSTSQALAKTAQQRAESIARLLASNLAEPIHTQDTNRLKKTLEQSRKMLSDIRYLEVYDRDQLLCRSPAHGIAPDRILNPVAPGSHPRGTNQQIKVQYNRQHLFFEIVWPIFKHPEKNGRQVFLQLGIRDETIRRQLTTVTRSILWTLSLCAMIGFGLAFLLSYMVTHPIHHLVQAVNRIADGKFETRADVFSDDEIGRLALAFNAMSEGLLNFRQEVQKQEEARLALIKKIVHAQEKERKTISLELHDQLGQSLLALLLMVQSLSKAPTHIGPMLKDLEVQIRTILEEVRRLAWGMRPSVLDDYGLDKALARLVEDIRTHTELIIDYHFSKPHESGRLPIEMEVTLYRIAQEAIANLVRHANATQASVVVLRQRHEVTLLIEDNGRGFQHDSNAGKSGSLGLIGMQERAILLGGSCAVESTLGQGTTIRVKIPLENT